MGFEGKELGNRYEILIKIGSGGMATVYKAKDKILKRFVAIKILRDEFITDEEFTKKFEQEAQNAARLTHPNIVSIYDVGKEDDFNYIVMELVNGKTLKETILEEKKPLPWKWAVNIASQIANALDVAHRNNIIHRDIKPHNIIVDENGIVKVMDFGIAKAVSNSTITAFGKTMGSVHYFSPEQARGGLTDERSDIYSLGVVLYEMVTGKLPFDSDTPVSVALKHMQEAPTEPRKINPKVPVALNDIIMKALQKEPNNRYHTAQEMYEDLQLALKNPNEQLVEEYIVDNSAPTQIIDSDELEDDDDLGFVQTHKKTLIAVGLIVVFAIAMLVTIFVIKYKSRFSNVVPEVSIPNVVGKTVEEAQQIVENANLKFEIEKEEYSKDVEINHIISQSPTYITGLNLVKEGSTIKVVVSKGIEKTKMPSVTGLTREEAIKKIEEAKLKADVIEDTSKTVAEGLVISQDVPVDTQLDVGDSVKIHVSIGTGIVQVEMIKVTGEQEATAKSNLETLNLKVTISTISDTSIDNGVVTKQSIEPGTMVDEGTIVNLTVNRVEAQKEVILYLNLPMLLGETNTDGDDTTTSTKNVNIVIRNVGSLETQNPPFSQTNVARTNKKFAAKVYGSGSKDYTVEILEGSNVIATRTINVNFGTQTSIDVN